MKRFKNILKGLFLGGILAALSAGSAFAEDDITKTFIAGTQINGVVVGGRTVEEAGKAIADSYSNTYSLTINEKNGEQEKIYGGDISLTTTVSPELLNELLAKQNAAGRVFGSEVPINTPLSVTTSYDQEKLNSKLDSLSCITDQVKTSNAYISAYEEGKDFTIIPEVYGDSLNVEKTKEAITQAVSSGQTYIDLNSIGVYDEVTKTAQDPALLKLMEDMNKCVDMTITYKIRGNDEVLPGSVIVTWLTGTDEGGLMGVDSNQIYAYIDGLKAKYDTSGTTRTLKTATGRDVSVSGAYGWAIDRDKEAAALIGMIRTGTTQDRVPEYSKKAASETGNDWGNTYVEVDLTGQHVYMIKDGALVWDAPCVTGNVSKDYTTPAGIYSIYSKERDRVLRGAKQADGSYEYESPVSYWMPFNGGIGLHDANWRGSFGGDIYKTSGSHGCVNLPPSKAPALFDLIYVGCPVICYNY